MKTLLNPTPAAIDGSKPLNDCRVSPRKSTEYFPTPQEYGGITHSKEITLKESYEYDKILNVATPTKLGRFDSISGVTVKGNRIALTRPNHKAYKDVTATTYKIDADTLETLLSVDIDRFIRDNNGFSRYQKATPRGVITVALEIYRKMRKDYIDPKYNKDASLISHNLISNASGIHANVVGARMLLVKLGVITIKAYRKFNHTSNTTYEYRLTDKYIKNIRQGCNRHVKITTYLKYNRRNSDCIGLKTTQDSATGLSVNSSILSEAKETLHGNSNIMLCCINQNNNTGGCKNTIHLWESEAFYIELIIKLDGIFIGSTKKTAKSINKQFR